MNSRWLAPYSWEFITAQNAALCAAKKALHGPTKEGHSACQQLWTREHAKEMGLVEAVEFCRKCHQAAPFCFYNGNTFAAVIRDVIQQLPLSEVERTTVRSMVGHIVAGVASTEEEKEFRLFCTKHGW